MMGLERVFVSCLSSSSSAILNNIFNSQSSLFSFGNFVRLNSTRATICRVKRLQFLRQYPTTVVNPDGSTFTIRYHEPRQIIKFPVDISALSEPQKRRHLERRKPKTKLNLDEEFEEETEFDSSKYLNLVKKK